MGQGVSKKPRMRAVLGQNLLINRPLVKRLIQNSGINKNDLVVDIGAGSGSLTAELANIAGKVIAVEIDTNLASKLSSRFINTENIKVVACDFKNFDFPSRDYKVFSNPPFNRSADLLKRLLFSNNPPMACHLILQQETARKYAGIGRETAVSLSLKPWFKFDIVHKFISSDFVPRPRVETVLLKVSKRENPLLSSEESEFYESFVYYGFSQWKLNLKLALNKIFSNLQWRHLAEDLGFPLRAKPSELSVEHWVGLYMFFRDNLQKKHWVISEG